MSRALASSSSSNSNCYTEAQAQVLREELKGGGAFFRKKLIEDLCSWAEMDEVLKSPLLALFDSTLRATLEAPMRKDGVPPGKLEYLCGFESMDTPLSDPDLLAALEFILASFLHDRAKVLFETETSSANADESMTGRLDNKRQRLNDPESWRNYFSNENEKVARDWISNASSAHRFRVYSAKSNTLCRRLCLKTMGPNHVLRAGRYRVIDLRRDFLPIPLAEWEEVQKYISDGRAATFQFRGFTLLAASRKVGVLEVGQVFKRITQTLIIAPVAFMELSTTNGHEEKGDYLNFPAKTEVNYRTGKWTFKNKQATTTFEPVLE